MNIKDISNNFEEIINNYRYGNIIYHNFSNIISVGINRVDITGFINTKFSNDETIDNVPILKQEIKIKDYSGNTVNFKNYKLYAVVIYEGSGNGSGHYLSRVLKEEQWYEYNDSIIKNVDGPIPDKENNRYITMLFYNIKGKYKRDHDKECDEAARSISSLNNPQINS